MKKIALLSIFLFCLIGSVFVLFQTSKKPNYIDITFKEYLSKIENKESFTIYLNKTSCSACQQMTPVVEEVIKQENLKIYSFNSDKDKDLDRNWFKENGIQMVPNIIIYEKGKEIKRLEDYHSVNELTKFLKD